MHNETLNIRLIFHLYNSSSNWKRKSNLGILTINLRSIIGKQSEFHTLLEYTKPDVICAMESWLKGVHPGKTPTVDAVSVRDSEVLPPTAGPTTMIGDSWRGSICAHSCTGPYRTHQKPRKKIHFGKANWDGLRTARQLPKLSEITT